MRFWAGLAVVGALIIAYSFVDDFVFARRAVSSKATVVSLSGMGRNRSAKITHQVNGNSVEASMPCDSFFGSIEAGVEVPILYSPDNPTTARLDHWVARHFPGLWMGLILVMLGASVCGVYYFASRKKSKNQMGLHEQKENER